MPGLLGAAVAVAVGEGELVVEDSDDADCIGVGVGDWVPVPWELSILHLKNVLWLLMLQLPSTQVTFLNISCQFQEDL